MSDIVKNAALMRQQCIVFDMTGFSLANMVSSPQPKIAFALTQR